MVTRHAGFYALGRAIPGVIGLVALSLYTRLLEPRDFGNYTVVLASVGVFNAIGFYWLRVAAVRHFPIETNDRPVFLGSLYWTYVVVALGCVVLAVALSFVIVRDSGLRSLIVVGTGLLLSQALFELRLDLTLASLQSSRYLGIAVVRSAVAAGTGTFLAYLGYGARGVIVGAIAGYLLAALVSGAINRSTVVLTRPSPRVLRTILSFGLPLAGVFSLGVFTNWSDRFLLAWLSGTSAAGQYGAVADLSAQTITALMMITTLSALPLAVRAYETAGPVAAEREVTLQGIALVNIALPAASGLVLLAPQISALVFGKAFQDAGRMLIPIIAVASLCAGLKAFYFDLAFQLSGATKRQLAVSGVGAVLNVILNLLLIPRFGVRGAAYSMLATFAIACAMSAVVGRRSFSMPLPLQDWSKAVGGTAVMAVWLLVLNEIDTSIHVVWRILSSVIIYALALLAFNAGGIREGLKTLMGSQKTRKSRS